MIVKIKKKLLHNILFGILTLILCIIFAEILIRIMYPQTLYNKYNPEHPDFPEFINYTEIGGLPKANLDLMRYGENNRLLHVKTNSQGYRSDEEFTVAKTNKKRVMFFGDSIMFGEGLNQEETLPAVFGSKNPTFQSYNFGVPAFSLGQAYLLFKQNMQYNPDYVVVSIFTNDIINEFPNDNKYGNPFFVHEGDSLQLYRYPSVYDEEEHASAILNHKKDKYTGFDKFLRTYSASYVLYKKVQSAKKFVKYPNENMGPRYQFYLKKPLQSVQYSATTLCILAQQFKQDAEKINATLVFMYVPDPIEADPIERASVLEADTIFHDDSEFDYSIIARYFNKCFELQNITYVDVYSLFTSDPDVNKLYNHPGSHWSAKGVEKVALELEKKI